MTSLIESHYLPSVAYFAALWGSSAVAIEKHEHYVKQTYRNRCHIMTTNGTQTLSIPVIAGHGKTSITDVRIDHAQKWVNNHWRTLQSAYGKSPFFEFYADDLEKILYARPAFLYDLNCQLLSMCLGWLKWNLPVGETMAYATTAGADVRDLRSLINPKKTQHLSGFYRPAPYAQVFGSTFAENLSVIDLVFCAGPGALQIVKASAVEK